MTGNKHDVCEFHFPCCIVQFHHVFQAVFRPLTLNFSANKMHVPGVIHAQGFLTEFHVELIEIEVVAVITCTTANFQRRSHP